MLTQLNAVIDGTTSHSTKLASEQVAGYPAQAGIQSIDHHLRSRTTYGFVRFADTCICWIPACARMTGLLEFDNA
jgi:hypothetical protein